LIVVHVADTVLVTSSISVPVVEKNNGIKIKNEIAEIHIAVFV
jgi:hypothetical protein